MFKGYNVLEIHKLKISEYFLSFWDSEFLSFILKDSIQRGVDAINHLA